MTLDPGYYSTQQAVTVAGCSLRQADYWCRAGVLNLSVPADGYGSHRRWSADDVALARVFTVLTALGAQHPALDHLAFAIDLDPGLWSQSVILTVDGDVVAVALDGRWPDGWVINLAGCRHHVFEKLSRQPAAV